MDWCCDVWIVLGGDCIGHLVGRLAEFCGCEGTEDKT